MAGLTDSATKRDFASHANLDPKKSGEQFAHQTVLDSAILPSTVAQSESDTLQTFTALSHATPEQRKKFEESTCREITYSSLGRSLWLTGARQLSFFEKYEKPDCSDPSSRQRMVLNLLDYRFAKPLPIGVFRGPELERMRSLYLTGKEVEPKTSKYAWDGRIPDFRSGAARGLPVVIIPLILKAPIVGVLLAGFGIGSGKSTIENSKVELQNAQNERSTNEATRENQRGKTTIVLSIISLVAGFLRVLNATSKAAPIQEVETPLAKVLSFDPSIRVAPLPPPPPDPGEEIISLVAVRAARTTPPVQTALKGPIQYSSNPSPTASPIGAPTVQTVAPLSTAQGSGVASQTANASMSAESTALSTANQMENGVLVCIGNTARAVVTKPQPVEVLPIRPLAAPGQLNDGPAQAVQNPLALVDRDGNHVSHASLLNDSLQWAASIFSSLLEMIMSNGGHKNAKEAASTNDGRDPLDEITSSIETEKARVTQLLQEGGFQQIGNTSFFQQGKKVVQINEKGQIVLFETSSSPAYEPQNKIAPQEELKKNGFTEIAPGIYYKEDTRFGNHLIIEQNGEIFIFKPASIDPTTKTERNERLKGLYDNPLIQQEELVFTEVKEAEITTYDEASKSIKHSKELVFVYMSPSFEVYYGWRNGYSWKTGAPIPNENHLILEIKQQRLLRSLSPQELGVKPSPQQIDVTLNGMDPNRLMAVMRQMGSLSQNENLATIIHRDDQVVRDLGLTHQDIADRLKYFVQLYHYIYNRMAMGRETTTMVSYNGQHFLLSGISYRGREHSPFNDGTWGSSDIFIINLEMVEPLFCPSLVPEMIGRYGFYNGNLQGNPSYRIPPELAAQVLFGRNFSETP